MARTTGVLFAATLLLTTATGAAGAEAVSLYDGRTTLIEETLPDPNDLWVVPTTLEAVNGFTLKPEGACLDELCVPVKQDEDGPLFVTRQDRGWFNVTELARRLGQSVAHDADHSVWSLGEVPVVAESYSSSALAPDFELPGRNGEIIRLSDFRGKKVLLVTWASW